MDDDLPPRVKYLMNEAIHDCFFLVGAEDDSADKIGAIKALLMADSEPFRVMLGNNELAETGDVRVTDVEPETFRCFLKCIYGASNVIIPKLTFEESARLLYVVEKYLVDVVKPEIIDHMGRFISIDTVFVALSHPICIQNKSLAVKILKILIHNFDKITNDDKFFKLDSNVITRILRLPMPVNEIEIWNAVLRWAKYNTGTSDGKVLRSCIYKFLKHIRFLTMDHGEFWEHVVSTGILLEDEINDICKALMFNQSCDTEHLCKIKINRYTINKVSNNMKSSIIKYPYQAFIHCSISSIGSLEFDQSNGLNSKTYFWAGHFWCISAGKKTQFNDHFLYVYVNCRGKTSTWECTAGIEIILFNQSGKDDSTMKCTYTFYQSSPGVGLPILKWNELINPVKGYLKGDNIILQARIRVPDS